MGISICNWKKRLDILDISSLWSSNIHFQQQLYSSQKKRIVLRMNFVAFTFYFHLKKRFRFSNIFHSSARVFTLNENNYGPQKER